MEAPQVVKTQLGNNKLVFQNYLFIFDKYVESGSQKAWRCDNKNKGCKARVWTDLLDNVLTELEKNQRVEHNHEIANVLSQHFKMEAKKRARQTNAPPTQIRNELMAELPGIDLTSFVPPTKNAIRQVIKRARESRNEQIDFEFDSPEMVSAIWTCFSKTETRGEAQCHYCSRILIQHQGSTKILWSHLKSNHKPEFAQLKQNQQVLVPSTSKAAANQSNNVDLNQFFAQNENPKMEVIKVKSTSKSNNKKRAKLSGNSYGGDFPSRGSSEVSSQADGRSTIPAVSHILVWSALSHEQNNPTYIMANLMDDGDDPLHSGYGELSISSVIHQKLGAVTEPSGCCFSTRMPANIVLNEFSNLGYRAIGMVNKRTDEVLWTLAKNN